MDHGKLVLKAAQISLKDFPQNESSNKASLRLTGDAPCFELYRDNPRWAEPKPAVSIPGVYSYFNRYQSSVCIGGRQFTLAIGDVHACIRFVDAAKLWFWDYRKRPIRDAIDTDFNLGLSQAKSDIENCGWLKNFLQKVENELIGNAFLSPAQKRTRKTFQRETFWIDWKNFQVSAENFIAELREFPNAKAYVDILVEALNTFEKTIESADRQFVKPSTQETVDVSINQAL